SCWRSNASRCARFSIYQTPNGSIYCLSASVTAFSDVARYNFCCCCHIAECWLAHSWYQWIFYERRSGMGTYDFYLIARLLDDAIFNDDCRYRVGLYNNVAHCMEGLQSHLLYRKRKNNTFSGVVFSFGFFVSFGAGTAFLLVPSETFGVTLPTEKMLQLIFTGDIICDICAGLFSGEASHVAVFKLLVNFEKKVFHSYMMSLHIVINCRI